MLRISQGGFTIFGRQATVILYIEIRESSMDVGTYFLASFRRSKDPDDRKLWFLMDLGEADIVPKLRVIFGRGGLIMVYAIQSHAEDVHYGGNFDMLIVLESMRLTKQKKMNPRVRLNHKSHSSKPYVFCFAISSRK